MYSQSELTSKSNVKEEPELIWFFSILLGVFYSAWKLPAAKCGGTLVCL